MQHKPKIVSVVSNGDALFPRLESIRPTISQRDLLRRATAARDELGAVKIRRARFEAIVIAVEREGPQQVGTRPPGAPMATRIHAGKSAWMTAASGALVAGCIGLALWLGSL